MLNTNDGGVRLRSLVSWAIIAYVGADLFFDFFDWVLPVNKFDEFTRRSYLAGFLGVTTLGLIVLAVILGAVMRGSSGRLIAMVALAELAVILVFGTLAWLVGFGFAFDDVNNAHETFGALRYLIQTPLLIAITALAAMWVMNVYTGAGGRMPMGGGSSPSQPSGQSM